MSAIFRVIEVFRLAQRRGPILVGESPPVTMSVGTRLVSRDDPTQRVEVIAVDLPTPSSLAEGRLAVVVSRDLGDLMVAGAEFEIITPEA